MAAAADSLAIMFDEREVNICVYVRYSNSSSSSSNSSGGTDGSCTQRSMSGQLIITEYNIKLVRIRSCKNTPKIIEAR